MAKKKKTKHGGMRPGGGAPQGEVNVDMSSALMRGLALALKESGQPSVYHLALKTGVPKATIAHAVLHGRTPGAVRSIERILAGLGYTILVVPIIPTLDK